MVPRAVLTSLIIVEAVDRHSILARPCQVFRPVRIDGSNVYIATSFVDILAQIRLAESVDLNGRTAILFPFGARFDAQLACGGTIALPITHHIVHL